MHKCKRKDCYYCHTHGGSNGAGSTTSLCCYMLETGEPRGCPADKCDKYIPRKKAKKLGRKTETI